MTANRGTTVDPLIIGARAILSLCQHSIEHLRSLDTDAPRMGTTPVSIQQRLGKLIAHHAGGAEVYEELKPWLVLADALGEDGTQPLPDTITGEQAVYIREIADLHLASARYRIQQRVAAWPQPTDDQETLHIKSRAVDEQHADLRFINLLTGAR